MTQSAVKVLLLGVEGTGKSLLLKRLQRVSSDGLDIKFDEIPSTIPTVGSNIINIIWNKVSYEFREVGGAMAPIWEKYYKDADVIIYMIDKSNPFQISFSCLMLLTLLSNKILCNKEFLVVFNKTDFHSPKSMVELKKIYRLKEITEQHKVTLIECSCVDKHGFDDIFTWLERFTIM